MWYFNPTTGTWVGQDTAQGNTGPTPTLTRIAPAVAYSDTDRAFALYGGLGFGSDRQVWKLDVTTKLWTQLPLPATTPPHLREMLNSFVYDKANNVFVLFGGVCLYDEVCPDYSLNGDTWVYRLATNTWQKMNPVNPPPARVQHLMAYDETNGVIVLFGGALANNTLAGDTWYYHYPSNTWTNATPASSPPPRYISQIAYDPLAKQTVVFGGSDTVSLLSDIWSLKLTAAGPAQVSVNLTAPAGGSSFEAPANIGLAATAASTSGSVTKVQFFAGATKIGEDTTSPYSLAWSAAVPGAYSLTAVATNSLGATATSAPVSVTITDTTAPTVAMTAPAAGTTVSGTVSVSASATDSIGVAGVQFLLDGAALGAEVTTAPYTMSWNTSSASSGTHTLSARARDAAGNQRTSTAISVTVANGSLSVSLTAPANGSTFEAGATVGLAASASSPGGSVTKVEFFAFSTKIGEDTSAPYAASVVANSPGTYSLTAVATDSLGATATSAPVSVTIVADTTAPTVAITAPAAGATVSGTVSVSASATDSVGVAGVQFLLDGAALGAEVTTAPYAVSWNTSSASSGTHMLSARARDAAGNQRTSTAISVTVANGALSVSLTAPASGSSFEAGSTVGLAATASSAGGSVTKVQFFAGATKIGEDTTSPYSLAWSVAVPGTYSLTAVATDSLGATATSAPVSVTITDTTAPTVAMTAPAAGATVSGTVSVSASTTDSVGVAGVQFLLDGAALGAEVTTAPYTVSWNTSSASSGTHTLSARAWDAAGNQRTSTAISVTVANGSLSVSLTAPANGSTFEAGATVGLAASASSPAGSVTKVEFFAGGTKIGEDASAPYSLSWGVGSPGTYALTAVATDSLGATATSAPVSISITDTTAPTVAITAPAAGATVSGTVSVSASATDSVGVAGVQFLLDGAALGAEVTTAPYAVSWNTSSASNGTHALSARARDAAGNQRTSTAINVTVSNNADSTPPTITSTSPAAGDNGVNRSTAVIVNFSEAMDPASVNANTITLRTASNVLVPATVTYSAGQRRATLNPSSQLATRSTYTVTVRGGSVDPRVKDLAGNALATDSVWSFTTK